MTAPTTSRRRQAEATRARLLEAGVQHFSRLPFDQVSVAAIAESAGTAHGLLFHHFGSKRGLYLAALGEAARRRRRRFDRIDEGSQEANVRALLEAHLAAIRSNPAVLRALLRGEVGADPEAGAILDEDRRHAIGRLCDELGLDPTDEAAQLSLRAWTGAVDEAAVASLDGQSVPLTLLTAVLLRLLHTSVTNLSILDPSLDVTTARAVVDPWAPPG